MEMRPLPCCCLLRKRKRGGGGDGDTVRKRVEKGSAGTENSADAAGTSADRTLPAPADLLRADQSGYHISARMFNLDGVFYRKTADDLQYVGHIRRWTLDPVYLHESARDCEGGRAFSGQPGVRAAESACRSTGEGARFARPRTAPGSSARLFRGEANACELVRLGERRRTVLPVAGRASLLTAERSESEPGERSGTGRARRAGRNMREKLRAENAKLPKELEAQKRKPPPADSK